LVEEKGEFSSSSSRGGKRKKPPFFIKTISSFEPFQYIGGEGGKKY